MKKGELIAEFAKRTELSGAAANEAVNTLITIITERLKKGDTVGITGFGTFSVTKRAARKGRNRRAQDVHLRIVARHHAPGGLRRDEGRLCECNRRGHR